MFRRCAGNGRFLKSVLSCLLTSDYAVGAYQILGRHTAHLPLAEYSELHGAFEHIPVIDQLVTECVRIQSRRFYYHKMLHAIHQGVQWAFADLRKNTDGLAFGLLQVGVRSGDRVLIIQSSNAETLALQVACAKVGAIAVLIPPQDMSAEKLRYYFNEFHPTVLVAQKWLTVRDTKSGKGGTPEKGKKSSAGQSGGVEKHAHFWATMHAVLPELGQSYPGQTYQWPQSHEFYFLKRVLLTDQDESLLGMMMQEANASGAASALMTAGSTRPLATEDKVGYGVGMPSPTEHLTVWGPFSYYEQRLRRLSFLLHPDDPILALEDPKPVAEDKFHTVYSHRHCTNAGYLFAHLLHLNPNTPFAVLPQHHTDPIGAIIAPYAALVSGAACSQLGTLFFNQSHVEEVLERLEEVRPLGLLGSWSDMDLLVRHIGDTGKQKVQSLQWFSIFELPHEEPATEKWLDKVGQAMGVEEIFVFRGPMEAACFLSYRSWKQGALGLVPHAEARVVGDRGTADAKILSRDTRGNLRLKGPHITAQFYNNAGLLTEMIDEKGLVSTSREAIIDAAGEIHYMNETQLY